MLKGVRREYQEQNRSRLQCPGHQTRELCSKLKHRYCSALSGTQFNLGCLRGQGKYPCTNCFCNEQLSASERHTIKRKLLLIKTTAKKQFLLLAKTTIDDMIWVTL